MGIFDIFKKRQEAPKKEEKVENPKGVAEGKNPREEAIPRAAAELLSRDEFFRIIMDICDWNRSGDDNAVLKPLITYLAKQSDEVIFAFEDVMAELLYELDTKALFERALKYYDHSDDTFLYSRCVALINGKQYFEDAKNGKVDDLWKSEFESVLYVARRAWSEKHGCDMDEFPHFPKHSYETGSNKEAWK